MNNTPQDAWFYSREGERIGPVTFAALQDVAKQAGLNPRLDMVWTHGMAEWQAAGEIDGLFERRTPPAPPEHLAPAAEPGQSPERESPAEVMAKEGGWPGARRRSFLIATLVFPVLWIIGFAAATPLLSARFGPEIMKFAAIGANFIPLVVSLYFGLQRLVNLGMSRWWYLGNFVPFLNLWLGYRCFACPAGYAYHKKLDGPGLFLAIIYWLLIAVVLLAVIAAIAVMFGAIGSPEIQKQIGDAIRAATAPKP